MQQALQAFDTQIDAIFYCPHGPNDNCNCRKPKPGLLLQIADYFQTPLTGVPFIGDSLRDVQAAQVVGCQPIYVQSGKPIKDASLLQGIPCYIDLAAASDALIYE